MMDLIWYPLRPRPATVAADGPRPICVAPAHVRRPHEGELCRRSSVVSAPPWRPLRRAAPPRRLDRLRGCFLVPAAATHSGAGFGQVTAAPSPPKPLLRLLRSRALQITYQGASGPVLGTNSSSNRLSSMQETETSSRSGGGGDTRSRWSEEGGSLHVAGAIHGGMSAAAGAGKSRALQKRGSLPA